ncbi:MAG: hypothetical protein MST10_07875 [Lentisphaeria bacterium]|nr:hypothetical protein [Lentisphaeria bacterium]
MINCMLCSQLIRVFIDRNVDALPELSRIDALPGEKISFQVAYRSDKKIPGALQLNLTGDKALLEKKRIRRVGNTVVEFLSNAALPENRDLGYENFHPGLYPDPLREDLNLAHACPGCSYAFFVELIIPENLPAGEYILQVKLHNNEPESSENYQESGVQKLSLHVGAQRLAPERLRNTHWFYADCLCRAHECEMFSERFWNLLEKYFCDMTAHGINMILTPHFYAAIGYCSRQ